MEPNEDDKHMWVWVRDHYLKLGDIISVFTLSGSSRALASTLVFANPFLTPPAGAPWWSSTSGAAAWSPSGILPSDSMEKPQWGEGGPYVYSMQQDEAEGPVHALLSAFGHEGWDPQDAAAEALQPPQEAIPPLFTGQVLEGPLHHGGVHGH